MRKGLIIYDNFGTVVTILMGIETVPIGVQAIVANIPDRLKSAYVNPVTKEVFFEVWPPEPIDEIEGDQETNE